MASERSATPSPEQFRAGTENQVTTAIVPKHHSTPLRGLDNVTSSSTESGRFGRMFRHLPVFEHTEASLHALSKRMIQEREEDKPLDADDDEDQNPMIPAGYTYLGQFIDHDITFDPASSLQRQNDPDALTDFRTPRFDLDSLYGRGPSDQPYLYVQSEKPVLRGRHGDLDVRGIHLLLGKSVSTNPLFAGPDLPRTNPDNPADARALSGDPRNDENLIISQLHSTFIRFHNAVVDLVADQTPLRGDDLFKEAQRRVRWHYQWIVIHDFLPKIAGQAVVDDIFRPEVILSGSEEGHFFKARLLFYHPKNKPYMPVEFSAAAYRFGHSMVRPSYFFNDLVRDRIDPVKRTPIFSGSSNPLSHLNGFRPLPEQWGFQWKYFFDVGEEDNLPQPSYRIDTQLVHPLGKLPKLVAQNPSSLAERNLLRGMRLGLPSGQSVAEAMGFTPLTNEQLGIVVGSELNLPRSVVLEFTDHAPLWYYILKEAELKCDGERLGPVGGRIVAEVLIGLLVGDPLSYMGVQPNWKPDLGTTVGEFRMPDLIKVAGAA